MHLIEKEFVQVLEERYASFALSVVTGRALPDLRDGLKPVQRRIIYAMYNDLNLLPDAQTRKSASVIGTVIAKYHPHGDQSSYEALVRMAQPFSMNHPLVIGQGNFGSQDGDPPAAYRYTEAKLAPISLELLQELNQDTVDFVPSFDGSASEPEVLPAKFPNLLVNGSSGIAVGLSTSIPPHNLREVCLACVEILENPNVSLQTLLNIIKGPDFPVKCEVLVSRSELFKIYSEGKGVIKVRGFVDIEQTARNKNLLVIRSVPYSVSKQQVVERIIDLIESKKWSFIEEVKDESDREIRVLLYLSNSVTPEKAREFLFKYTQLEIDFPVNLTVIDTTSNGKYIPVQLDLFSLLKKFISFRKNCVRRKIKFRINVLGRKIHLLEGVQVILRHFDRFISIVRGSKSRKECFEKVKSAFKLTDEQTEYLISMRVYQLNKQSIDDLVKEHKDLSKEKADLEKTLKSEPKIDSIIIEELRQIADQYGVARRTKIVSKFEDSRLNLEDLIGDEEWCLVVSESGWIKRLKGPSDERAEGELLRQRARLSAIVTFVTNFGNLYGLKAIDFPHTTGNGIPVQNKLKMLDGEKIIWAFTGKDSESLLFYNRSGFGGIKKIEPLMAPRRKPKTVLKGEQEFMVLSLSSEYVVIETNTGRIGIIKADDIPTIEGRKAKRLVRLKDGEFVEKVNAVSENNFEVDFLNILGDKTTDQVNKAQALERYGIQVGGSPRKR